MGSPLTVEMVAAIMPNARANGLDNEFEDLLETCRRYEVNTKNRVAAFLMNVAKESGELFYAEEIADGWAYEGRGDLGNIVSGDGPRFKGHGYIQITGRKNHRKVGEALGVDAISDPLVLTRMPYAWLSAGHYWTRMGNDPYDPSRNGSVNLNEFADLGDYKATIHGVRGGPDPDREHYWRTAMEILPDDLDLSKGETRMVKASEIVAAARSVIGAPYRMWYEGASIPMYRDDGYSTAPPVWFLMRSGLMCSDLLNAAREMCGLTPVGGTEAWEHFIVDWAPFDPNTPGIPGAVAVNGYTDEANQGHVGLYTGEHSFIQSLLNPGVTEDFTDYETHGWGGWCDFQWYGLQPDIDYSEYLGGSTPVEEDWQRHGYFDLSDLYVPGSTGHDPASFWGRWITAGDGRDYIEVVRED